MKEQEKISETVMETYNHYKQGKSINQIAELRELAETTIQGHFEQLILNKLVALDEVIDKTKKEEILEALEENDFETLKEIKELLDDSISYGEIRCVRAFLKLHEEDKETLNNPLKRFEKIRVLTVKEITRHIKNLLESDDTLTNFFVKGEISNLKEASSGHIYFSLKDDETQIKCAFFRRANERLNFKLENGMKIIVRGGIEVYIPRGEYSMIVEEVHPDGLGALHLAFTQLKDKLEKEGLFSKNYKKIIPKFPRTMGVITSTSGAALQDILKVLKKRYPLVKVIISPALVQGKESAHSIVKSIELINELPHLDVIILGRGGGSLEDLWSFNEEIVARAIFKSEIPIISAVGHETDFTISDFVADKRAATPSVAAEIAVPDIKDIYEQIIHLQKRSTQSIQHKLNLCRSYIEQINSRVIFKKPLEIVHKNYRVLDQISSNLNNLTIKFIQNKKEELRIVESEIISLSPKTILNSYNVELNQKKI